MPETHRCNNPSSADATRWRGPFAFDGPAWECPKCGTWWGYGWPGQGAGPNDKAWMPMHSFFIGHKPEEFDGLLNKYYAEMDAKREAERPAREKNELRDKILKTKQELFDKHAELESLLFEFEDKYGEVITWPGRVI